jgi:peptidoglycan/xylan/chitin deacetylase (PgdA/CDA1 family)
VAAVRRLFLTFRLPPVVVRAALRAAGAGERGDSLALDYAFWRGARSELARAGLWRSIVRPPAILMYHAFAADDSEENRFVLSTRRLVRQLRWLRFTRRKVVPLDHVVDALLAGQLLPPNLVVITMDDGYRDIADVAMPVLRREGATATAYLVADRLGDSNRWDDDGILTGRPLLAAAEIPLHEPMLAYGGHTATHPDLTALPDDMLAKEVAGGRRTLMATLGRDVRTFAYPHGRHGGREQAAARAAGYQAAVSIERGLNDPAVDPFRLRRTEVDGRRSLLAFELAVRFGDADLLERIRGALRRPRPDAAPGG